MRDKNFWLQLLVSAAIPLVLGSGTIFIFSQFKERLPDWAYDILVIIVYVVFVIVLGVLCLVLLRLTFGGWFTNLRIWYSLRFLYRKRLKIATDWYNQWLKLSRLLSSVSDDDFQATNEQETEYGRLRLWFIRNRSQFLPIWYQFQRDRTIAAHETTRSSADLNHEVFHDHYEDPFSYFYKPSAIENFREILRYHERDLTTVLVRLVERLDECFEWVKLK